jgi:hypothetical protein
MLFRFDSGVDSLPELWFLLFRPKRCPTCRGRLERLYVPPEQTQGWERGWEGLNYRVDYVVASKERHKYRCPRCHAYYWLSELMAKSE